MPNELSEGIATEHLAVVDAMAKMLGVRITFVPEVRDSNGNLQNAKIVGKDIYIAAGATQIETISFLTGHEFTHRMKKLSPEQYAKLEDSVRNYLGNEAWEAEMATHTNTYRKVQRNITDEEIAEEVVADFIGRQVRDNNLFTQYLDSIKDKGLVDAIKSVLRAIRDFFRNINATAKDKALDEVISNLNTLIESASTKAESAENTEAKFSARLSADELAEIEAERKSIIETAKANGTYLKAPNGQPTNLTPKQWVEVRTKRFKAWFGDWEKAARIEKLRESENVSISGNEIVPSGDMKEYRKNALEYGKTIRGEYVNTDTGSSIVINKDSLTEVLHHDGSNIAHIQSIAAIPQMVESGIYITSEPVSETASKKLRNAKKAHYYVCGLNIGDVPYTVKFVVAEFESGEKYYDHSLTEIEKGELLNRAELSSTVAESKTPISDIKDKRLISILQTNSSKIVDANGEPKVVYHRTPRIFCSYVMITCQTTKIAPSLRYSTK